MLLPVRKRSSSRPTSAGSLHGVRGGLVAGLLFILPGALAILALSWLYGLLGDLAVVEGLVFGLKAAVLAIVVQALMRIANRTLRGVLKPALAIAAFVALFAFDIPFPLVVLGAGAIGHLGANAFGNGVILNEPGDTIDVAFRPGTRRAALACLVLWGLTVGALYAALGGDNVYTEIATFFSKMAVATFEGPTPYWPTWHSRAWSTWVAAAGRDARRPGAGRDDARSAHPRHAVRRFRGIPPGRPGVSLVAGTLGALLTTWVTFLPSFLWIFAGAPYGEAAGPPCAVGGTGRDHRGRRRRHRQPGAVVRPEPAVRGTRAGERFRLDLLLPVPATVRLPELALTAVALVLVFVLRLGMAAVLGVTAALGIAWRLSMAT